MTTESEVDGAPPFSVKFIELVDSVLAYSSPWDDRLQALSATVACRCFQYRRASDVLVAAQYLLDASEFLLRDENLRLPAKRPLMLAIVLNTLRRREFDLELLGFGGAAAGVGGRTTAPRGAGAAPMPVVSHEPTCSGEQLAVAWRYRAVLITSLEVAVRILETSRRRSDHSRSRSGRGSGRRPRSVELEEGFAVQVVALAFFRLPKLRAHIVAALVHSAAASEEAVLNAGKRGAPTSESKEFDGAARGAASAGGGASGEMKPAVGALRKRVSSGDVVALAAAEKAAEATTAPGTPLRERVGAMLGEVERRMLASKAARSDHGGASFIAENPSLFLWSWFHREAATAVAGGAWSAAVQPRSAFEARQLELQQQQEERVDALTRAPCAPERDAGTATGAVGGDAAGGARAISVGARPSTEPGDGPHSNAGGAASRHRSWIQRLANEHDLFFEFAASVNDHVWAQARGGVRWGMVQGYLPLMRFFVGAYTRMAEWRCPSLRRELERAAPSARTPLSSSGGGDSARASAAAASATSGGNAIPRWSPLEIRSALRCSSTMMRNAHMLDLLIQIAFFTTNANLLPDVERCFNQVRRVPRPSPPFHAPSFASAAAARAVLTPPSHRLSPPTSAPPGRAADAVVPGGISGSHGVPATKGAWRYFAAARHARSAARRGGGVPRG
jgi:hypothetical protein